MVGPSGAAPCLKHLSTVVVQWLDRRAFEVEARGLPDGGGAGRCCVRREDEACGFNPWFELLREVKAQARGRLAAGEDPAAIRWGFLERIGEGDRGASRPDARSAAGGRGLAPDAVLRAEDRDDVDDPAGRRSRRTGDVFGHRTSRG